MRKLLINKLDYRQRQWFFKALLQLIVVDKSIHPQEVEDLKEAIRTMAGKVFKDPKDIFRSPKFKEPLKPLENISYEQAFIILVELARAAAIDSRIVLEEKEMLKNVCSLLEFSEEGVDKLLSWAERLALVNKEEEDLKREMVDYFRSG